MENSRLVIEILKDSLSKLYAGLEIDFLQIDSTILKLKKELDKKIINKSDTKDIEQLINDLEFVKFEILTGDHN